MILLITYGPHANEHFRWGEFVPPAKLELQSHRPGIGGLGGRAVGVAVYEREPERLSLPHRHVGYRYERFEERDSPPLFHARVQE